MTNLDDLEEIFGIEEQVYVYACYMPSKKTSVIIKAAN